MFVPSGRRAYLIISAAVVAGLYFPWAMANGFALRYWTEALYVWLLFAIPPMMLASLVASVAYRSRKAVSRERIARASARK